MMRILIVGSTGQLGKALFKVFSKNHRVFGTYVKNKEEEMIHLQITNKKEIEKVFEKIKPEVVILTAAITRVDYCERHQHEAYKVNVEGVKNVVDICKKHNSKLVFISTYYLFDGEKEVYTEEDEPNPPCFYSETKFKAEKIVGGLSDFLIFRMGKIFSYGYDNRNFAARVINNLKKGIEIEVSDDQITNPIYADNAAEVIMDLVEKQETGVYNLGGAEKIILYNFALKIADYFNLNKELLKPIKTDQSKVKRPLKCSLDMSKLEKKSDVELLSVDNSLKNMCRSFLNE